MKDDFSNSHSRLVIARMIAGAVALGTLVQIWILGLQMPLEVPIHFDFDGNPDRFSSRETNLWLMTGLVVVTMLFVLGVSWLIPRIPESMVNLPNKDHWLAPQRKLSTYLRIQTLLLWVGAMTTLLYSALAFLSWRVAMQYATSISPWIWIITATYMGAVLAMCTLSFRRVPTAQST